MIGADRLTDEELKKIQAKNLPPIKFNKINPYIAENKQTPEELNKRWNGVKFSYKKKEIDPRWYIVIALAGIAVGFLCR